MCQGVDLRVLKVTGDYVLLLDKLRAVYRHCRLLGMHVVVTAFRQEKAKEAAVASPFVGDYTRSWSLVCDRMATAGCRLFIFRVAELEDMNGA
jgi:hypothetical protein